MATYFDAQLGEFILKYDQVQTAQSPSAALLEFCQSTYEAGARQFEILHNRQFPQYLTRTQARAQRLSA